MSIYIYPEEIWINKETCFFFYKEALINIDFAQYRLCILFKVFNNLDVTSDYLEHRRNQ